MRVKKLMPATFFVLGILFAFVTYSLSFSSLGLLAEQPSSGAPVAFALLSAASFFCCAYLLKSKDKP